jgi:uncharacterized protein
MPPESTGSTPDPSKEPTFNAEDFKDLAFNAMSMRSDLLKKFMDPRRDYDKECGYPTTADIRVDLLKERYDRDPIASRIVDYLSDECWKVQPSVFEDEDTETQTPFEEAWKKLSQGLQGGSLYQDEESSPIWEYLNRLDRLCGIGSFGVLLLGFDDLEPEETLTKPLRGFEDASESPESFPQKETSGAGKSKEEINLVFLRVFDESLVEISQYEQDMSNPRFGQPKMYRLTFTNPNDVTKGGIGQPLATQQVHWSRVIHVADNLNSSEIFGEPRMRPVWNRLLDLNKLYGGSAEMYWKGAFPGLSLNIDPKMGGDVGIDTDAIRGAMWNYTNSLQRWFALAGVSAQSLSPQVVDPTQQINVQIEAICVKLAIPIRIFKGSERGELASSQDANSWDSRLKHRQKTFITPRIIIPFVDRLIKAGVLPTPKGYSITWPDIGAMNATTQAGYATAIVGAMSSYILGGCEVLMEPFDFFTRLCGLPEKEVRAFLEARITTLEEKQEAQHEQDTMQQLQGLEQMDQAPNADPNAPQDPTA